MRPMRTILVPLDGSAFAESALPIALDVARRATAAVTLVAVHTPALPAHGAQGVPALDQRLEHELRADVRTYLDLVRRRIERDAAGVPRIDAVVLDGAVAETVSAYADRAAADLVVLTSHGRGGLRRLWLGSVTYSLVRRLDVPLLVVRPGAAGAAPASAAFRRVLLPIDGTRESELGAESAMSLVGAAGAEFTLLRVLPEMPELLVDVVSPEQVVEDAAAQRELASRELASAGARLRARGAAVRTAVRFDRSAAASILAFAAEERMDLIALASHGRGPIGRLLLGSVADEVLRAAAVPVLVERFHGRAAAADERRASVPDAAPAGVA